MLHLSLDLSVRHGIRPRTGLHGREADVLQAGEDLVGLRQRQAAQLDVGARRDVAAAGVAEGRDRVAQEPQLPRVQLPVGHLRGR